MFADRQTDRQTDRHDKSFLLFFFHADREKGPGKKNQYQRRKRKRGRRRRRKLVKRKRKKGPSRKNAGWLRCQILYQIMLYYTYMDISLLFDKKDR